MEAHGSDALVEALNEHLLGRVRNAKTFDSKVVLDECEGLLEADLAYVHYRVTYRDECHMCIELTSQERTVAEMLSLLEGLRDRREEVHACATFYFQQKHSTMREPVHHLAAVPERRFANAPPRLCFEQRAFHTNKTFASLHGGAVQKVERRMRLFHRNRDWYDERGVPYQLGMLFSGRPGCGKSSVIKAMARALGRHIVSVDMSAVLTTAQLHSLFYDETLSDSSSRNWRVPQHKRLYVIEEVDKSGGVLLADAPAHKVHDAQLSLRDVLDVLDGGMESPGRVVIMTANEPEKLHETVRRAGRLDFAVDFGVVDDDMLTCIHRRILDSEPSVHLPGAGILTPAEATEAILSAFTDGEEAVRAALDQAAQRLPQVGIAPTASPQ